MGPVSAKSYFSRRWADQRPLITPDYGMRGALWVFGAFEPSTGLAVTTCAERRDSLHLLTLLDHAQQQWPEGELILILDNLSVHRAVNVRLWALTHPHVHFLFQPTYAPWLNLIEPWWKTLRSLALTGRRFETPLEVELAITHATAYWNLHRHPYRWQHAA